MKPLEIGTRVAIEVEGDMDREYGKIVGYHDVQRADGPAFVYAVDVGKPYVLMGEHEEVHPVLLDWESAEHDDEPGDQNASSACVEHGHWSLGPQADGTWGVELIEQDADLNENPTGGIHLGHFPSEKAAKGAAEQYERKHRDDRNIWSVPILLHIEAKTASGAADKVWNTIVGDGEELTIDNGHETITVYANGPMDPAAFGGTQHIYTLDKEGKPE